MVQWYLDTVKTFPFAAAAVQFGVLGTLGEHLPVFIQKRRITTSHSGFKFLATVLGWAVLGVIIKVGFLGTRGALTALLNHGIIPQFFAQGLGFALALSVLTNVFFGPQMMAFHRLSDNLIARKWNFSGLPKAWWTLLWFWIPAHTLTFALPQEFQIGLAALWSVILGLILGLTKK